MATSPTTALPSISPARDPLMIVFQDAAALASANPEPTELEVQVEIEDTYASASWRRIGEFLNPYNAANTASVLIHRALLGALKPSPPDLSTSTAQQINGLIKNYRLLARDVVGGVPSGNFTATGSAHAWLAGSSYHNSGIDLAGKAYLFLTTKPLTRSYHASEKILIYLLPLVSGADAVLNTLIHFTDGTTQADTTKSFGAVAPYRPKYINYTLPAVAKTISHIEFDITGLTGTAEKLTYKLISKPTPYFSQLIYLNSLGGFDSLPMMGKTEESHTDTGEIFEGQLFPPLDAQEGNYRTFNQRSLESFTLRSGWISLQERNALKDMTLRNEAYLVVNNQLRKIIITNATHPVRKDGEYLYSIEITARYAYDHAAYSR